MTKTREQMIEAAKAYQTAVDWMQYRGTSFEYLADFALAQIAESERRLSIAVEALEFYKEKADAVSRYLPEVPNFEMAARTITAILTELSLDAGIRGKHAIAQIRGEATSSTSETVSTS